MKILGFAVIGIMMMTALSSCEKKYTCTCVYPNSSIGTTTTTFKASKKSDAQATCNVQNSGAKSSGGSCAL